MSIENATIRKMLSDALEKKGSLIEEIKRIDKEIFREDAVIETLRAILSNDKGVLQEKPITERVLPPLHNEKGKTTRLYLLEALSSSNRKMKVAEIRSAMENSGWHTDSDKPDTIIWALSGKLIQQGLIEKHEGAMYTITSKGVEAIAES